MPRRTPTFIGVGNGGAGGGGASGGGSSTETGTSRQPPSLVLGGMTRQKPQTGGRGADISLRTVIVPGRQASGNGSTGGGASIGKVSTGNGATGNGATGNGASIGSTGNGNGASLGGGASLGSTGGGNGASLGGSSQIGTMELGGLDPNKRRRVDCSDPRWQGTEFCPGTGTPQPGTPEYCKDPRFENTELCRGGSGGNVPPPSADDAPCRARLASIFSGNLEQMARQDELCGDWARAQLAATGVASKPAGSVGGDPMYGVLARRYDRSLVRMAASNSPAEAQWAKAKMNERTRPAGSARPSMTDRAEVLRCLNDFAMMTPDRQFAVIRGSGNLANYASVSREIPALRAGDQAAAHRVANFVASFSLDSPELVVFCGSVAAVMRGNYAPAGIAASNAWPLNTQPMPVRIDTRLSAPTNAYSFIPAGNVTPPEDEFATLFLGLAPEAKARAISGPGFVAAMPFSRELAAAYRAGLRTFAGQPIDAVALRHIAVVAPTGSAEHALFSVDVVQNATAQGLLPTNYRAAGNPAPSEQTPPPGFSSAQWGQLLQQNPEVAARLWTEYNQRPSTFQQVSQSILQASQQVLQNVQAGRANDLERYRAETDRMTNLARLENERMTAAANALAPQGASLAQTAAPQVDPTAIATSVAQAMAQAQAQRSQAQSTQQTQEGLSTGAKVGIGVAALAAVGVGVMALRPSRPSRENGAKWLDSLMGKKAKGRASKSRKSTKAASSKGR